MRGLAARRGPAYRCAHAGYRVTPDGEGIAMSRTRIEFIHEGRYAAEVTVERGEEGAWEPYLSPDDARKLEAVRLALRRGDIAEAAKHGRIFGLTPIST
jgi:hypothetical protein